MIGIIADDLSGACDTAVKMQKGAQAVKVILEGFENLDGQERAVAVSTDSRLMDRQQAYKATYDAVIALQSRGITDIYKKIDSMFRGNVVSEVQGALDACGHDIAVIAAAVPVYDRQIINGMLIAGHDGGKPFHIWERYFSKLDDDSALITMQVINAGVVSVQEKILEAHRRGCKMILMDSEFDQSLDIIAAAIADLPIRVLPVGASPLLEAMMRVSGENDAGEADFSGVIPGKGRSFLFAIGSQHAASRRQVKLLLENPDAVCVRVNVENCIRGNGDEEAEKCLCKAQKLLLDHPGAMVLAVDSIFGDKPLHANDESGEISFGEIVDCVSRVTKGMMETHSFDAMMVTGGETARMVLRSLGVSAISLLGEYAPGIPIGIVRTQYGQELTVAIKSGGFGVDSVMTDFIEVCKNAAGSYGEGSAM